jgi:TonB family protein
MKYIIASMLIHGAVLSIPTVTKVLLPVEPIEVFLMDQGGSSSPSGGGGKQGMPAGKPHRGGARPVANEQVRIQPHKPLSRSSEHKTGPLPHATASVPGNEPVAHNDSVGLPGPGEERATANGWTVSGTGSGGGAGGGSSGTGGRGSGTGSGSGSGQGDGSGGGNAGFGSPGGPRFLHREVPEYPLLARRRNKEGSVLLMVVIDAAGRLTKVDVIEASDKVFVEPSLESIRKSTFLPARKNERPVASRALLPIRFSMTK